MGRSRRLLFTELAKDFTIYSAASLASGPVKSFDDIVPGQSEEELHTDLVMYRSTSSDMDPLFEATISEFVR
jgi:hypothetical protein